MLRSFLLALLSVVLSVQLFAQGAHVDVQVPTASGRGVLIHKNDEVIESNGIEWNVGYVATAYHVVKSSDKIAVIYNDRHLSSAKTVVSNPHADVTILKVLVPVDIDALALAETVEAGDKITFPYLEGVFGHTFDLSEIAVFLLF